MNASNRRSRRVVIGALICILLIGALIVSAQSSPPSIPIGENQTGSLADASSSVQFSIAVPVPQNVNIQVLATSPGFAPAFRVLDPNNAVVLDVANSGAQSIVQGSLTVSSFGTYIIEVRSANNTPGQFTISVQPGAPLTPPLPLPLNQLITAAVDAQTPRQAFSFTALSTDALLLDVASTDPNTSPVIHLSNADTGNTLGLSNALLTEARFRMPIGSTHYLLEVNDNGSDLPQSVTICLWPEHSPSPCPGSGSSGTVPQNPTPVATQNNACTCQVTVSSSVPVNIRAFPGGGIIGQLPANTPAQVIGELPNHLWIKISYGGTTGWVLTTVVTINDTCPGIPVITLTPPPPPHILPTPTGTLIRLGRPTLPPPVNSTPTTTNPNATPTPPLRNNNVPTATPRFQLPQLTLVFHFPTPTPTKVVIK